jgi:hypothetical protein
LPELHGIDRGLTIGGALSKTPLPVRLLVNQLVHTNGRDAMRYLCLIYDDESKMGIRPKDQADTMNAEYYEFTDSIKKGGQYVGGEALQPTSAATTVRVRGGKVSTTDGPYAETKEQLGGYYLINAKDLNEAIQIASRIPSARSGSIEVRPIREFKQS